jgi:nitronate monooxygenase
VAIEEGVPYVSFSWGTDAGLIRRAQRGGATVLVQVGSTVEALEAVTAGADIVVAQGIEAGGHVRSTTALRSLLHDVRRIISRPLIAAGGIGDADAVRQAVTDGADGVACGTAFLAAQEADVHPRYLDRLIDASADDTILTGLFDGGWPDAPHRVLRGSTVTSWLAAGRPGPGARPGEGDIVAHRAGLPIMRYGDAQPSKATTGDIDAMAMYAGLSVGSIDGSESAARIVHRLALGLG